MVGSPQEIIDKILAEREVLGIDRFMGQVDFGGMPAGMVHDSIELLATEIAPSSAGNSPHPLDRPQPDELLNRRRGRRRPRSCDMRTLFENDDRPENLEESYGVEIDQRPVDVRQPGHSTSSARSQQTQDADVVSTKALSEALLAEYDELLARHAPPRRAPRPRAELALMVSDSDRAATSMPPPRAPRAGPGPRCRPRCRSRPRVARDRRADAS